MSGMAKAERLEEMKRLYIQRAYSDIEMAERLGVDRTLIYRDRIELTGQYPIEKDDEGRYHIPRTKLISEVKVNLHEALTLYLTARKTSRQTRFHHPHAANALEKLAGTLRQPMTEKLLKAADAVLKKEKDPERIKIIEILAQAWVEQKKVRVRYQPFGMDEFRNHVIHPYLIEPSIWSDSIYVIAYSEVTERITPFKFDRVDSAFLSGETFEIPADFDDQQLLKHAWGIWYGDKEPVTVMLRFSPSAARRVKESIWHPLEKVIDTEDGGCLWSAEVAEWREMLPWVRGWGADCEVIEPDRLRKEVIQHVRDLALQYKVMASEMKTYSVLWAKADKKDETKVHRLVYHLIDVGQVAHEMWKKAIDVESKRQFCQWLGCDEDTAGQTLAFLISLHDLGKASPSFQIKVKSMQGEVRKAGFWLPTIKPSQTSPHGVVSAWALSLLLPDLLKISEQDAKKISRAVGGHHGTWIIPAQLQPNSLTLIDKGNNEAIWDTARKELAEDMLTIFIPASGFTLPQDPQELNIFLTLLSGFASVADWIGSMTEFFPYEKSINVPLEEYTSRAAANAEKALAELGWFNWQADGKTLTFKEMFPFIAVPNSVQQTIMDEVAKTQLPTLLILESPTGSGKTEAALYAADTWLQSQRGSGMYIAMPTQATSNQMYERVTKFLRQRYPDEILNFHLVHGGALLEDNKAQTEGVYDEDQTDSQGGIRAESWFLPRKRTLLAPFGVGTVDQALMSVLQTRHFFVRMFGLRNKVVVFDEVHAYDTYMSELFKRLLIWLKQIGVSVILLSATLPEKTRRDLTAAYLGADEMDLPAAEYPRLTLASSAGIQSISLESPSSRTVQLKPCDTQPQTIIEHLRTALGHGGCAAVICNRVARAQELYREIKAAGLVPEEDLILFHARFPFAWREEIERSVLGRFGKGENGEPNPNRPRKSIVVATQVIEQSLDLDFDFMVSDLAPIDLLIQRAGRLHRHSKNDSSRPVNLQAPALLISFPQTDDIPEFGHDEYVYERSVMLKTWLALKDKTEMTMPGETTALIEAVYGGEIEIKDEALQKEMEIAIEKAEGKERKATFDAVQQLIKAPDEDDLLSQRNGNLDEDDPTVHKAFRAMTRDADPSISLICLHRVNGDLYLDTEGITNPLDISTKPDKDLVKQLLRQNINVQNRTVLDAFAYKDPELTWKHWKEVAALKYAMPVIFENGRCKLEGKKYALILDRQTGLTILKEEQ
ncbi:MAG: CRISPR-associated helicase Cas3' [Chloroflexi bacterium]|nr:CRISPR-associated helicase Cas3' [Chloroflexota bacterium]